MSPETRPALSSVRRRQVVGRTSPDGDGVSYPLVRVPHCTCAGWGGRCEPNCGLEPDDSRPIRVFDPEMEDIT